MRILGYHISDNIIINSDGESVEKSPYIGFLLAKKPATIRVFDNLSVAVANLADMLNWGSEKTSELNETTKICIPPYHFRYVPNKFFSIKKPRAFAYYGDVSRYVRYVDGKSPLELAILARDIGERVYKELQFLGFKPINLIKASEIIPHL